ncbi:hypothetical protein [Nocardia testacea]|uniref:hypothetical protein n=1 Tax=Nocardia testacea TaxID=248551 RepID=UPI0002FDEDD5|nr:hypothetical protein [Nocardia testacea]
MAEVPLPYAMEAPMAAPKWVADGTWGRVFTALTAQADAESDREWVVVDSTVDRAQQHATGSR